MLAMKRTEFLIALILCGGALAPHAAAQLRKAERALSEQNFEQAHAIVRARLEEKPDDHKAYDMLARIYETEAMQAEGEDIIVHWDSMLAVYGTLLAKRPKSEAEVASKLHNAYIISFRTGVDLYSEAMEEVDADMQMARFTDSKLWFIAAARVGPDSLDPHLNWAYAALSAGNQMEAVAPLRRALEIGPVEVEWYSQLGRVYLANDSAEAAVTVLEDGVERFPIEEELQSLLLNAYAMAGQNDRAIERYRQRVQTMPDDRITRYNLGSLLLSAEQYDEAIEHLKAATEIDDQHIDSHYNLGAAFINKATDVQKRAAALDDTLRAQRDSLDREVVKAREEAIYALENEKRDLMSQAIAPLERAKMLTEAAELDISNVCRALYQAYAQANAMDKVEEVKACAGY